MDWNCAFTEERLSDYLDGALSPTEADAFSTHAAGCADCSQTVAMVSGVVNQMRNMEMIEEPPHLVAKILDATLGPRAQKEGWRRWFDWVPMLWQPRFAMGLATVAALLVVISYTSGLTPAKLRKADLSPTSMLRSANRQAHLTYARGAKFVNDLRVVYEIQSKLQPEPEPQPVSNPAPAPNQEHNSQPPNTTPQQKSQTAPLPSRTQVHTGPMFAFLLTESLADSIAENTINASTRSTR
jgi:anti-sigma factor RsiW